MNDPPKRLRQLGGNAARFGSLRMRFSSPVCPGDTLRLHAWPDGLQRVLFEGRVGDKGVVSNAWFRWR